MSERMRQPETRCILSEQAKAQWENPAYKSYMGEQWRRFFDGDAVYREASGARLLQAQREYWSDAANREAQAERVRTFFANNPTIREAFRQRSLAQWQDEELLAWRRQATRGQWTPEFRVKRCAALDRTYYRKSLAALKQFETAEGVISVEAYEAHRAATRDRSLLRFDRFCQRYFGGDAARAREAVGNYNHRVVSVERLEDRVDVYDLEVPGTHNFALASGVFVHNSAKNGRDRRHQAVLPLRGKPLNVEKARIDKALENEEIKSLITALGTGIANHTNGNGNGEVDEEELKEAKSRFDITRLRYDRVIVMTDADIDGAHIRTLLLTFFYRYMKPLIDDGHIYLAKPPLYGIRISGKDPIYCWSDQERDEKLKGLSSRSNVHVQRFKGLGEMNADQLADTTMDISKRNLLRVTMEDAVKAEEMFSMLMGDRVQPRKEFIEAHAREVRDLDV